MIIKTSKRDSLKIVSDALKRLDNETFSQFNRVGTDWLFISTNDSTYVEFSTSTMSGQFTISVYNKCTERSAKEYYNVTRPTMYAIHKLLAKRHTEYTPRY
jgi:hypothetical protein